LDMKYFLISSDFVMYYIYCHLIISIIFVANIDCHVMTNKYVGIEIGQEEAYSTNMYK